MIYFYGLLEISTDETAQGLFDLIINNWKDEANPDFYMYMKTFLYGYASDGAAVMLGKNNGLQTKFQEFAGRNIYSIHCMAHRCRYNENMFYTKR